MGNREIKFRAWDTEKKEFFKPTYEAYAGRLEDLSIDFSGELLRRTLEQPAEHESMFPGRFILMQYTGLKDKNGKEIYEGYIVKQTYHTQTGHVYDGTDMTFDGHHIGEVVITARGVSLKNPLHYSEDTDETNPMNAYKQVAGYRSEVIGNVFEHPHLLKEAESNEQAKEAND